LDEQATDYLYTQHSSLLLVQQILPVGSTPGDSVPAMRQKHQHFLVQLEPWWGVVRFEWDRTL
jgi:hypothetical protein